MVARICEELRARRRRARARRRHRLRLPGGRARRARRRGRLDRARARAGRAQPARRSCGRATARVEVFVGDGTLGVPERAPYDAIAVAAAAPEPPPALYDQLAVGGRLAVPVGQPARAAARDRHPRAGRAGGRPLGAVPVRAARRPGGIRRVAVCGQFTQPGEGAGGRRCYARAVASWSAPPARPRLARDRSHARCARPPPQLAAAHAVLHRRLERLRRQPRRLRRAGRGLRLSTTSSRRRAPSSSR